MFNKQLILERLSSTGDPDSPIGSFIFSSLDLAHFLELLLEDFDPDERNAVLQLVFEKFELNSITPKQLVDAIHDHIRSAGKA